MIFGCCKKAFGVSFELVSGLERTRLVTYANTVGYSCERDHSNAFGVSFERVWLLVRTRLTFRLNPFWLLVRKRLAFCSNAFHTTIERVQAVERTRSYVERTRLDKKCVIPCA